MCIRDRLSAPRAGLAIMDLEGQLPQLSPATARVAPGKAARSTATGTA